jgi:hypothetical protein
MSLAHEVSVLKHTRRSHQLNTSFLGGVHGTERLVYMTNPQHQQIKQDVGVKRNLHAYLAFK